MKYIKLFENGTPPVTNSDATRKLIDCFKQSIQALNNGDIELALKLRDEYTNSKNVGANTFDPEVVQLFRELVKVATEKGAMQRYVDTATEMHQRRMNRPLH